MVIIQSNLLIFLVKTVAEFFKDVYDIYVCSFLVSFLAHTILYKMKVFVELKHFLPG